MKERRSCSKVKPWLYFSLELLLFVMIGSIIALMVGGKYGVYAGILLIFAMLYKTRAVQRLERVLERTEEVRRAKVRERYEELNEG